MNRLLTCLLFITVIVPSLSAQTVAGKLVFEQGQNLQVVTEVQNTLAQQANNQSIDFTTNGSAVHTYRVTNATADNTTLRHGVSRFSFSFDGMGAKKQFDSQNKKDMDSQFGKPVKEMLGKQYDIVVDANGKAMFCKPDKFEFFQSDDQLSFITGMVPDLTAMFFPPEEGQNSFFWVLPASDVAIGETWNVSTDNETEKSATAYTLTAITDSTILVDYKTNGTYTLKSEMRGIPVVSNLTSTATGKIVLDKKTKLLKEKITVIESSGTAGVAGTSTPVNSKTTIKVTVTEQPATNMKKH